MTTALVKIFSLIESGSRVIGCRVVCTENSRSSQNYREKKVKGGFNRRSPRNDLVVRITKSEWIAF